MAGKGTLPKLHPVRDAAGAKQQPPIRRLVADGRTYGPELPSGYEWPTQTRSTYDALRTDAIAPTLTPSDWLHLQDTMRLHAVLWTEDGPAALRVAAEVRLRLAQLGVTPEARLRLRTMVDTDPEPLSVLDQLRERHRQRQDRLRAK